MIRNSSPPHRNSRSCARRHWRAARTVPTSTRSPAAWPSSSLIALKRSRSKQTSDSGRPAARDRSCSRSKCSAKARRLKAPVRSSRWLSAALSSPRPASAAVSAIVLTSSAPTSTTRKVAISPRRGSSRSPLTVTASSGMSSARVSRRRPSIARPASVTQTKPRSSTVLRADSSRRGAPSRAAVSACARSQPHQSSGATTRQSCARSPKIQPSHNR